MNYHKLSSSRFQIKHCQMPYTYHLLNRADGWLTPYRGYTSVYNMLRIAWSYDCTILLQVHYLLLQEEVLNYIFILKLIILRFLFFRKSYSFPIKIRYSSAVCGTGFFSKKSLPSHKFTFL